MSDNINNALHALSADCERDKWFKIGAAYKEAGGDFATYDKWSATAPQRYDAHNCKATWESITPGKGITEKTLFFMAKEAGYKPPKTEKRYVYYDYVNEARELIFQVMRMEKNGNKTFIQRRPKQNNPDNKNSGHWFNNLKGLDNLPLYNLPNIKTQKTVFFLEGEKDVNTAQSLSIPATCNNGGASNIAKCDFNVLSGKKIFILPDNDTAGIQGALKVYEALKDIAAELYIIKPPIDKEKADFTDWIQSLKAQSFDDGSINLKVKDYCLKPDNHLSPDALQSKPELLKSESSDPYAPLTEAEKRYGTPVIVRENESGKLSVEFNQRAIAGCFYSDFKNKLLAYDSELRQFYGYDAKTGLWVLDNEDLIREALSEFITKKLPRETWGKVTANLVKNCIEYLKGIANKTGIFDCKGEFIHVANGVLEITPDGVKLKPFAPLCYSRNRSEIAYNSKAECPQFIRELLKPALPGDDIELVQKYGGQCLLGSNPAQKLLILRGTAGGGKGTLVNVISQIIGKRNIAELRTQHLRDRFEVFNFIGKTLLTGADVPGNFLNTAGASTIKSLVGNDALTAEGKGLNNRATIQGNFNIIISTNTRLHVRLDSDSGAWKRRLLIVDYERPKPEKKISFFDDVLIKNEGEGVLNWFIKGAVMLKKELSTDNGDLKLSPAQNKRVDDLLNESDSIRAFASEMLEISKGDNITCEELLTEYFNFCETKGWQAEKTTSFNRNIVNAMIEIHRAHKRTDVKRNDKNQRGFFNIRLK
jgi:P4 family phage/plasmid primase-like protien